jgi:hypothetical protein
MLFVLLFVSGILILPVMLDIRKHGEDNIFRRSGRDLLQYHSVQATLARLHVSVSQVNTAVVGAFSVALVFLALYVAVKLLEFGGALFGLVFR